MTPDILIIIGYFVMLLVPVGVVVVFLWLQANPRTAHLPLAADSYHLPPEALQAPLRAPRGTNGDL